MSTGGAASPALAPDADAPAGEGLALAQFAAGCFWSVELVYQRLPGVARTEVGYSQGHRDAPTYELVCAHGTGHAEVVRLHYDPAACPYAKLLGAFWAKSPRPIPPRSTGRARTSGVAGGAAGEVGGRDRHRDPAGEGAKRFYPAEEYHQRYLEKGGQSAAKGCTDPMRCYG